MNLYEISNEYQTILNQSFDPETGEINEASLEKINTLSNEFNEKGIAIASYIKNLQAENDAIEKAVFAMFERQKKIEKKMYELESYLKTNMERLSIEKISCPYFSISIKKCPQSVSITNIELIPAAYKKIKTLESLDRKKMLEEMKEGVIIEGAELHQNSRLEIK